MSASIRFLLSCVSRFGVIMRKIVIFLFSVCLAICQQPPAEKPVKLYPGLGVWRHTIHTSSAEAQKFFDQGLALMYGFNRYESLRSFRKVAELDPNAAMAYWGMAMAQGPYINMEGDAELNMKASCAAVEAGLKLAGTPERERAYLQAASARCPAYEPQHYIDAARTLRTRWPDDLDALILYAESLMIPVRWHWYAADGTPAPGVTEAERTLEEVLRRWPEHPGANHLYIHAVESSPSPERAIASAQRLMGIMPQAGHIVHMPGHIWLVLGDWEMAASVNERAVAVDRQYLAESQVTTSGYGAYYVHNLHFIAYARWMQGRKADGLRASAEMASAMAPMVEAMPEMADSFNSVTMLGHVRFQDWDGILHMKQPKEALRLSTAVWHYARAMALSARGDRTAAAREQAAFEAIRTQIPPEAPWGNNKAKDVMAMVSEVLAARLAASPMEAVPHWRQAVAMQDALVYDEPPPWYYPLRESLGAALLRAGKAGEAESVFRDGVKRSPRNGRMLFGLMHSLKAQKKTEDAEWVKREFDAAWAKADVKLTVEEL
jgi:tetratricopeptide (TPR) repeat protein